MNIYFQEQNNMIEWIDVNNKYHSPDYCTNVLVAYHDKDTNDNKGIAFASLQYNYEIGEDYWNIDFLSLKGEDYDPEYSIITHWFPYLDEFNYPDNYE